MAPPNHNEAGSSSSRSDRPSSIASHHRRRSSTNQTLSEQRVGHQLLLNNPKARPTSAKPALSPVPGTFTLFSLACPLPFLFIPLRLVFFFSRFLAVHFVCPFFLLCACRSSPVLSRSRYHVLCEDLSASWQGRDFPCSILLPLSSLFLAIPSLASYKTAAMG